MDKVVDRFKEVFKEKSKFVKEKWRYFINKTLFITDVGVFKELLKTEGVTTTLSPTATFDKPLEIIPVKFGEKEIEVLNPVILIPSTKYFEEMTEEFKSLGLPINTDQVIDIVAEHEFGHIITELFNLEFIENQARKYPRFKDTAKKMYSFFLTPESLWEKEIHAERIGHSLSKLQCVI